jgi:hypothetical protein
MSARQGHSAPRAPSRKLLSALGALAACLPKAAALSLKGRWWSAACGREVQLSFETDTILRSYVYTAYPVGILLARGMDVDQLCPHYLQLLFPDSKLTAAGRQRSHVRFFPAYRIEHLAALGYFATREWTSHAIDRPHALIIGDLVRVLESGRYLLVRANEAYMPGSRNFLRVDHRHGFLITGYTPRQRCFVGPAYGTDGEFRLREVPAMFMAEAIRNARGGVVGTYNETRQVIEVEPTSTAAAPVNPAQILARLRDYVRGIDNAHKYLGGAFTPPPLMNALPAYYDGHDRQGTYGTRIYDSFRRYLSVVIADAGALDLRATRVLMDHKHMMATCLRLLANDGWIPPAIPESYADVIALATALHHAALAWTVTRDPSTGRRVYDLLDDLQSAEMESLGVLRFCGQGQPRADPAVG